MSKISARIGYWALHACSLACVFGAALIEYFSVNRLGMVRWVNYQTMRVQGVFDLRLATYVVCVLLVLMALVCVFRVVRHRHRVRFGCMQIIQIILAGVLVIAYVYLVLVVPPLQVRSYYFACLLIALASTAELVVTCSYTLRILSETKLR